MMFGEDSGGQLGVGGAGSGPTRVVQMCHHVGSELVFAPSAQGSRPSTSNPPLPFHPEKKAEPAQVPREPPPESPDTREPGRGESRRKTHGPTMCQRWTAKSCAQAPALGKHFGAED